MALDTYFQFGEEGKYPTDDKSKHRIRGMRCHVMRPHGKYHPDGPARCERLEITIVAPGLQDLQFMDWYVNRTSKSGHVVINMPTEALDGSTQMEIVFKNAVCFRLEEEFDLPTTGVRLLTLSFEAEEMKIGGQKL